VPETPAVACPHCHSVKVRQLELAEDMRTIKMQCDDCKQPFFVAWPPLPPR
jgi:hypothetical protein